MKTPVILLRSLNVERGGITKATLKRANMFAKVYKKVIIVTIRYQQNHKRIITELRSRGKLAKNIIVYNFFEDMRQQRSKPLLTKKINHNIKEKGYFEFKVNHHPNESYRYYKDGFYKMYKRFKNGKLQFIDYKGNNGKNIARAEYDENGFLVRERFMDTKLNKSSFDKYYDFKGECMLSVHVNPKTDKDGIALKSSKRLISYEKIESLQANWLDKLLKKVNQPVLFNENRGTIDNIVNRLKNKSLKKIAVIHMSHLKAPYDDISSIENSYEKLFTKYNYDKYIFLTNEQKRDVESIYGKNKKYHIIPHSYKTSEEELEENNINRDPNLVVYVARYAIDKRIDEAINAFKYVVEQKKEAKLYIYGKGPLKTKLQDLIVKLGLEKNVYLKGYTNNPKNTYRSAACSVITSRKEGFGLVIIESMAEGTPVVAYDFKYGPKDIINEGKDGFIVKNGDRKALAKRILDILENEETRSFLSKNAKTAEQRFNESDYEYKWLELIK